MNTRRENYLIVKWKFDRWLSRNGDTIVALCWFVFVALAVWFLGVGILW